mmetsp:Transcript_22234/g.31052  ORF Transcript_22234/g.31052 Transcript_22234/m.31052 type:complete len:119 (+) Transcript_22234:94-450(+)|eukprot:CAMPEP_0184492620 /NCGR_PEP_ID=MMETSP0113_2-20130426/23839_1 /TAXON_ID=91329 /ORGANISM="Norrisiella sphaerica, Strain BC52" /LENGTH=118 /DNA_ID=CAMNT_0026877523 /DNA_START=44 /DNA_END=400 /DNA_ORIENTATION=-
MSDTKKKPEEKKQSEGKKDSGLVVIKVQKMPETLAQIAVKTVAEGIEKFNDLHESCDYVKSKFESDSFVDEETGEKISTKGVWHCVLGRKFGSFVTYAEGNFIQFYIGQLCCLIWKSS